MSHRFTLRDLASGAALLAVAALALSAPASNGATVPVQEVEDDDEPVRDGKWLYGRYCAGCHNDNGDGKGPTILALGRTARDFQQGGFAFGDTPEQLVKTITTGIPGRSPMPSFKGVLSDEEIGLVIGHVRTLMPARKDEGGPKNTEIVVRDRPVIARGKLPPIREGAKEVPRGLLIGTPEGMTFEYDLDGVKLLGVRIGRFADREDWGGRGGGYLKPLGQLVWDDERAGGAGAGDDLRVLVSAWCRAQGAGLAYEIRQGGAGGPRIAQVEEDVATIPLSVGPAYRWTRRATFPDTTPFVKRNACVLPSFRERPVDSAGGPVPPLPRWSLRDRGELGIDATRIEVEVAENSTLCRATTVRVEAWSDELAAQLEKELAK